MSFDMDDEVGGVEIGQPVSAIVGGAAEIVSVGQSALRTAAIANALGNQGVSVTLAAPSSANVTAFNANSAGKYGQSPSVASPSGPSRSMSLA